MRSLFNVFAGDALPEFGSSDQFVLAPVTVSSAGVKEELAAERQAGITTSFVELTGADNPFDGIDFGTNAVPIFANLFDNGGRRSVVAKTFDFDLETVVGTGDGTLRVFFSTSFDELDETENVFIDIDVGDMATAAFADLSSANGLELVVGSADGTLRLFEFNFPFGRASLEPALNELTGADNPFDGIDVGTNSAPVFFDLDGDFDLDLVVGAGDGTIRVFESNFGSSFTELTGADNPFDGIDVGTNAKPVFVDLDDDGDTDLVVGAGDGTIRVFDKNDDDEGYTELTGADNPFNGLNFGSNAAIGFVDFDNDDDPDAIIGGADGTLRVFENLLPANVDPTAAGDLGFALNEGAAYVLTSADFLATDVDNRDRDLEITITSVRNGVVLVDGFQRNSFTNADVEAGLVQFVHSGRPNPNASIALTIEDPEGGSSTARISVDVTGPNVIDGTSGNDSLEGTDLNDLINGLGGADTINGGAGRDIIAGGDQNDTLFGGDGNDIVNGQRGADFLYGGAGNDLVLGGNRNDRLFGEDGNDRVFGGNDQDIIEGGEGNDIVRGGNGDDQLFGNTGDDVMFGGTGRDRLEGGDGDDFLSGRGGFDILIGGAGNDTLEGGVQADTFIFINNNNGLLNSEADVNGHDTITDFAANNNAERIDLSGVIDIDDFQDLVDNHMVQDGDNVVISFGSELGRGGNAFEVGFDGSITLLNVDINDLDAVDFIF